MGTINSATSPWATSGTVDEAEARHALGAVFGRGPGTPVRAEGGVIEGAAPTASASGTTCTVSGHGLVALTSDGTPWVCSSLSSLGCPLDAVPAAGTSRWDLIVGEVVAGVYRLRSVTGTAAASPSVPGVPANTIPLFRVQVTNSGAQTPVPIMPFTRAAGAARLADYDASRAGSYVGDRRKFSTGAEDVWNGSAWVPLIAPAAWSQENSPFYFAGAGPVSAGTVGLGTGGVSICRYKLTGKDLTAKWRMRLGAGSNGGAGDITTRLPAGLISGAEPTYMPATLYIGGEAGYAGPANLTGFTWVPPNSNVVYPWFPILFVAPAALSHAVLRNADNTVGRGTGVPRQPNGYPLVPGSEVFLGTGIIEVQ